MCLGLSPYLWSHRKGLVLLPCLLPVLSIPQEWEELDLPAPLVVQTLGQVIHI